MRTVLLFLSLFIIFKSLPAAAACTAPAAKGDDKVVFLNVFSGASAATYSVAGQDEVTTVVSVHIAKGDGSLHIVAAVGTPVIWRVWGEVPRVSAFVAVGPATRGDKTVKAGVDGIEGAKVSFARLRDCIPVVSQDADSGEGKEALAAVKTMAGRDVTASAYAVSAQQFDVGQFVTQEKSESELDLKGITIVAPVPAVAYEVLPQEAGLAQLVEEGKLIKSPEGTGIYKIVKEIPRYPPGLTGTHAVRFILGKGIKAPAGDPGHSCVITEETEQPLNARISYNCER